MTIKTNYLPKNSPCDTGEQLKQLAFVTVHWVGPYPGQTPEIVRQYWIDSGTEASAHVIIKDDVVLECWPLDKKAWHTGHGVGNDYSVGIELIPENTRGKFSDKTIATLKEYLNTYLKDKPILRHYDWNKKLCPAYYVDHNNWTELLAKLV